MANSIMNDSDISKIQFNKYIYTALKALQDIHFLLYMENQSNINRKAHTLKINNNLYYTNGEIHVNVFMSTCIELYPLSD